MEILSTNKLNNNYYVALPKIIVFFPNQKTLLLIGFINRCRNTSKNI